MKLQVQGDAVVVAVKVVPNASRTEVVGLLGEALKVKVQQPPEDGKANRAVEALIAAVVGVGEKQVRVIAGETRAHKRVRIEGVTEAAVREKLMAAF